ncbi:hypothetical protein F5Y10DRAFT_293821 [Nemania abortiva]|nr:hypothetical protein F5Y10DRAFT_293821 [Nemania abortiva]
MSGLTRLPPEILHETFEKLVPDLVEAVADLPLYDEYYEQQRALYNLTLVSRSIGEISTEYLYRNLVIKSTKEMVLLFRTLDKNLDLRKYPRFLANLVPLMEAKFREEMDENIRTHFPLLPNALAFPSGRPLWTHKIIERLLIILPHLEDVLTVIHCIPTEAPDPYRDQPDIAFFAPGSHSATHSGNQVARTLRIQPEWCVEPPGDWLSYESWLPLFQLGFTPFSWNGCEVTDLRFLNMANVTAYEIHGSFCHGLGHFFGNDWPDSENGGAQSRQLLRWLARLEKLSLINSNLYPEEVGRLLSCCSNLKKLCWLVDGQEILNEMDIYSSNVQEALQHGADHLEHITVRMNFLRGPISFRSFRALRVLDVGIEVVTNFSPVLTTADEHEGLENKCSMAKDPLASLLPDSLVCLSVWSHRLVLLKAHQDARWPLFVMNGWLDHSDELYQPWLADGLKAFAKDCQHLLPNLSRFTITQPIGMGDPNSVTCETALVEVNSLVDEFDAAGVEHYMDFILAAEHDYIS